MAAARNQRAEVSSAFFVAYVALSVSVIGFGIVTQVSDPKTAGLLFTGLVATVAAAGAALIAPRTRGLNHPQNSTQE